MPESYRSPSENNASKRSVSVNLRVLAVLVMVIGAVGFFAARIFLGDRPLVLFITTLVTFVGLGMVIFARRISGPPAEQSLQPPERISRRNIPPGLRPRRGAAHLRQPGQTESERINASRINLASEGVHSAGVQTIPEIFTPIPLLEQAVLAFASQGAQVERSAQRPGRGLLTITTADGRRGVALVLADAADITLADVRGLAATAQHNRSTFGYLVTEGRIPSDAMAWAAAHASEVSLSLVRQAQLAEIRL